MNRPPCDHEAALLTAARAGALPPALADHLAGCATCGEALAVDALLRRAAVERASVAGRRLPDPGLLLFRARRAALAAERERALAPIRFWERLTAGLGLALAAAFVLWRADALLTLLQQATTAATRPEGADPVLTALLVVVGSALAFALLWLTASPAEE